MPTHRPTSYEQTKAARAAIDGAAAMIRRTAIHEGYAGFQKPELAFIIAEVLDTLSLNAADLNGHVRAAVVADCRRMLQWARVQPGATIDGIAGARGALDQT